MTAVIEKREMTVSPHAMGAPERRVNLILATFAPHELEAVAPAARDGLTAHRSLQSRAMPRARFAFGGIYFQEQSQAGRMRRVPDGFIFSRPGEGKGEIIAPPAPFQTGGFLLFDRADETQLLRQQHLDLRSASDGTLVCTRDEQKREACRDIQSYRLIVQSNVILVHGAREDGNNDVISASRAALGVHRSGRAVFVATEAALTLREFGDLLVAVGVHAAINLDGHTSVQLAERQADGTIKDWFSHRPEPMALLFHVRE